MTQAQRNSIQNQQLATNTYFELRAVNRAARAAEAGPKPTEEQLVRLAHYGIPKPPSTMDVNPVNGKIDWPSLLQTDSFQSPRGEVDQLFAKQASYGGLGYSDQSKVREALDSMTALLKAQIADVPPQAYVASKNFLKSLAYAATKSYLE